jgi:SAM-dependent methyltransferase
MVKSFIKKLPGIRDVVAQRDALNRELAEEQSRNAELNASLAKESERLHEQAAAVAQLREERQQLRAEVEAQKTANRDTIGKVGEERQQRQELLAEFTKRTEALEAARGRLRELKERTAATVQRVQADAEAKQERARAQVATANARVETANAKVEKIRADADAQVETANAKVEKIRADADARIVKTDAMIVKKKEEFTAARERAASDMRASQREAKRMRQAMLTERGRAREARAEAARERETKQEVRRQVMARAWKPGYARNPNYLAARDRFVEQCVDLGKLQPDGRVLDVGCGIGGIAERLVDVLDDRTGSYVGFDVDGRAIEVANDSIAAFNPNFVFEQADVWNSKYNPEGSAKPHEYVFPHPDDDFDLIVLRSVFTHMLPDEVDHYMGEIARVLKPGGRAMITWFLLTPETLALIEEAGTKVQHDFGVYRLLNPDRPEAAVAFQKTWVDDLYSKYGLVIAEPVHFGSWSKPDADKATAGQDLVTAEKPAG